MVKCTDCGKETEGGYTVMGYFYCYTCYHKQCESGKEPESVPEVKPVESGKKRIKFICNYCEKRRYNQNKPVTPCSCGKNTWRT